MGRHPERQLRVIAIVKRKHNGSRNGHRLYALLRGGQPIASMFHLQPPPDICG